MKTQSSNRLWYVAIALGWLFDFLFWKKAPGINFALFATLCLLGGFYLLLADGLRPSYKSLILLPFFVFFAVMSFVRAEPMTTFLSYTLTLFRDDRILGHIFGRQLDQILSHRLSWPVA